MPNPLVRWFVRGLKGPDSPEVCEEVRAIISRLEQLPAEKWHRRGTTLDGQRVIVEEQWSEGLIGGERVSYSLEIGERSFVGPDGSGLGQVIAPLYRRVKQFDIEQRAKADEEATQRMT